MRNYTYWDDIEKRRLRRIASDKIIVEKIDFVFDLCRTGQIESEFINDFIRSVGAKHEAGFSLTDKQLSKLDELYKRYKGE